MTRLLRCLELNTRQSMNTNVKNTALKNPLNIFILINETLKLNIVHFHNNIGYEGCISKQTF